MDDFDVNPPLWLHWLNLSNVCLCPERATLGGGKLIADFRDCLPLLGGCDYLVFSEPTRTVAEVVDRLSQVEGHARHGITILSVDAQNLPDSGIGQLGADWLDWQAQPDWIPKTTKPQKKRM